MNLIDLKVIQIKEEPYQIECIKSNWFLKVIAESYGRESESILMFKTKKEAENIKIGYIFQG